MYATRDCRRNGLDSSPSSLRWLFKAGWWKCDRSCIAKLLSRRAEHINFTRSWCKISFSSSGGICLAYHDRSMLSTSLNVGHFESIPTNVGAPSSPQHHIPRALAMLQFAFRVYLPYRNMLRSLGSTDIKRGYSRNLARTTTLLYSIGAVSS
jgi:hypothetical protein